METIVEQQTIMIGDCLQLLPELAAAGVDIVMTSPPYNLAMPYTVYNDPQTAKTTWVARRNNRVFITGNSFPVELARRCIKLHGVTEALVLDPFAGTGTTLVAAAQLGCSAIGIELDPAYAATAITRLQASQEAMERSSSP